MCVCNECVCVCIGQSPCCMSENVNAIVCVCQHSTLYVRISSSRTSLLDDVHSLLLYLSSLLLIEPISSCSLIIIKQTSVSHNFSLEGLNLTI